MNNTAANLTHEINSAHVGVVDSQLNKAIRILSDTINPLLPQAWQLSVTSTRLQGSSLYQRITKNVYYQTFLTTKDLRFWKKQNLIWAASSPAAAALSNNDHTINDDEIMNGKQTRHPPTDPCIMQNPPRLDLSTWKTLYIVRQTI